FAVTLGSHKTKAFGWDVAPELLAVALLGLVQQEGFATATAEDVSVGRLLGALGYDIHFTPALASIALLGVLASGTDTATGHAYALLSNGLSAVVTADGE